MVKEEISLIDLKAGLPTETLAQSNDFCLMNACPSPPLRGFPPSPALDKQGGDPQALLEENAGFFSWWTRARKAQRGQVPHQVQGWGPMLVHGRNQRRGTTKGCSSVSLLWDQPSLSFLCSSDRVHREERLLIQTVATL